METTDNILHEMREFADADSQTIGRDILRRKIQCFADRIKVAHKQEMTRAFMRGLREGVKDIASRIRRAITEIISTYGIREGE